MSTVEEHFAVLRAMKPREGGWLTDRFHQSAAIFLGAHLDELEEAWKLAHPAESDADSPSEASAGTLPPDALQAAEARATQAEAENETLRLAICGGEDAPGYAASLTLETILQVQRDHFASMRRDSELAWDGETATSWKSRALQAEAREAVLREALTLAAERVRAWEGDAYDRGDDPLPAMIDAALLPSKGG